jgi:hypothetical protein
MCEVAEEDSPVKAGLDKVSCRFPVSGSDILIASSGTRLKDRSGIKNIK